MYTAPFSLTLFQKRKREPFRSDCSSISVQASQLNRFIDAVIIAAAAYIKPSSLCRIQQKLDLLLRVNRVIALQSFHSRISKEFKLALKFLVPKGAFSRPTKRMCPYRNASCGENRVNDLLGVQTVTLCFAGI